MPLIAFAPESTAVVASHCLSVFFFGGAVSAQARQLASTRPRGLGKADLTLAPPLQAKAEVGAAA